MSAFKRRGTAGPETAGYPAQPHPDTPWPPPVDNPRGYPPQQGYTPPAPVVDDDEFVVVDVCAPLRTTVYPLLKLIAVTGLSWIAVGVIDRTEPVMGLDLPPWSHNAVVLAWLVVSVLVFVVPLVAGRRRRLTVTNHRITVSGYGRAGIDGDYPIHLVGGASRQKNDVLFSVATSPYPVRVPGVARPKKTAGAINAMIDRHRRMFYYY
ncbi:hypothetical protein ACFSSC_11070 [Corynebacterium mendelii]|uniref:Uncharacterized protein n=1 Tax=Corynebacterium mendelii TaxID=2765362 RepID=A0A939E062_9CORY|nr:hypothetical protein [Corynebacterium mendelii]MBN9644500.1 hypothetical protein [Corynebacterium mendelii]